MIAKITALMMFVIMLIALWAAYWMFWPMKAVEVGQPYKLHETVVKSGGILKYTFDYCRFTDADVEIHHQVIGNVNMRINGATTFNVESASLRLHKGCGTATKGVPLPGNLPPGKYYLEENLSYFVHPLRTIRVTLRTEDFEVVE